MQLYDKDLLSMQEVRELVGAAKKAQQELAEKSQEEVDRIVRSIANAGVRNARRLAQMAHDIGRLVQRICLHTSRRQQKRSCKTDIQYVCCLGSDGSVARSKLELCSVGTLFLRFPHARKAVSQKAS